MDPTNQVFAHDAEKYAFQPRDMPVPVPLHEPTKQFNVNPPEKSEETKKDLEKQKDQQSDANKKKFRKPFQLD